MTKLDDSLPLWLTPVQVAKHLQVSQQTIYNMVHAKQLPHRWIGGRIRIPRSVLEEDPNASTQHAAALQRANQRRR